MALTNVTLKYGLEIANTNLDTSNPIIRSGINTQDGKICCEAVADSLGIEFKYLQEDYSDVVH
jgi:alanine dehydrogenase